MVLGLQQLMRLPLLRRSPSPTLPVRGELVFGAHNSARTQANLERVRELAKLCPVLVCDEETAYQYGWLKDQLRQKGQPIPENDLWIAPGEPVP